MRANPPRAVLPNDRKRILRELSDWSRGESFLALRTRAHVLLAAGSALRVKEIVALDLEQVLEQSPGPTGKKKRWRVRSSAYLRAGQSKGRRQGDRRWNSAGQFVLTKKARAAVRAYIALCVRRGWLELPPKPGQPLFISNRRRTGNEPHPRVSKRTLQHAWHKLQQRAGLPKSAWYGVHDLRHDALTRFSDRCSGNVFQVAKYGRMSEKTAQRYVHTSPATIAQIAELAET